jgi:hypothetical protein
VYSVGSNTEGSEGTGNSEGTEDVEDIVNSYYWAYRDIDY